MSEGNPYMGHQCTHRLVVKMVKVYSPCGGKDGEGILVFVEGVKVLPPEYGWAGRGTDTNKQIWRGKTSLFNFHVHLIKMGRPEKKAMEIRMHF